ncbi:MAG: hypothetical protein PWP27_186 [Clostridiales bacterium]|nr:hypothetical protein [Clostridiales bacterium]
MKIQSYWEVNRLMATEKQIDYIKSLYEKLGQEAEDDIYNLSNVEASERIKELKQMQDKESGTDNCYWY